MKKSKSLWCTLIVMLIIITSCSNDNDNNTNNLINNFTFNNETYEIDFVRSSTFLDGIHLTLANDNYLTGDYTGEISSVSIFFEDTQMLNVGTYTFKQNTETDFNSSIHFYNSEAMISVNVLNGNSTLINGTNFYQNLNNGTIIIEQIGNNYSIGISLDFDGATLEGSYEGPIQENYL